MKTKLMLVPHLAITGDSAKVITIYIFSFFLNIQLFIWLHWVLVVTCGIYFLDQGLNLGSLNLEHGVSWLITHLSRDITCTDHVALMH